MGQAILYGALLVIVLVVIWMLVKEKTDFIIHSSRGIFMRDLNKKMEEKGPEK